MMMRNGVFSALVGASVFFVGCGGLTRTETLDLSSPEIISSFSEPGVERSITRLTDDLYRFRNNNHTSLFLVTSEGIALIDPLNVSTAEWVQEEIARHFDQPVTHVLYSHGHQDHASGAAVFEGAEILSHENTFDVITPAADEPLPARYALLDENGSGALSPTELLENFAEHDFDGNGVISGAEAYRYFFKDVAPPTQTYSEAVRSVEIGDKTIEMHFVGGNHASDMSYIFFPDKKLVFYVDVISLGAIPFGALPWYSQADSANTYEKALAIGAEIVVPSHGPIGTQDDVRDLRAYMADLRRAVSEAIDEGMTLEEIQSSLVLEDYADWDFYEPRFAQNIVGMHRALMAERAD